LFGVPKRQGGTFSTTVNNQAVTLVRPTTTSRWTFILDGEGKVVYKDTQVNAQQDTAKVLAFVKTLK
jgi:peroxiredoxin Q/BCP